MATFHEAAGLRGFLHRADGAFVGGAVLAHGAGSGVDSPALVAACAALAAAGLLAWRIELPFRARRAKGPPGRGDGPEDRAGLRRAAAAMRDMAGGGPVALGGHSYGGRQASILAAEEPGAADALLLLSYPLHPPQRPASLRTAHFPQLALPCLFVHGERDPFGAIAELEAAAAAIPGGAKVLAVPGAGHDLKRGRADFAPVAAALMSAIGRRSA